MQACQKEPNRSTRIKLLLFFQLNQRLDFGHPGGEGWAASGSTAIFCLTRGGSFHQGPVRLDRADGLQGPGRNR